MSQTIHTTKKIHITCKQYKQVDTRGKRVSCSKLNKIEPVKVTISIELFKSNHVESNNIKTKNNKKKKLSTIYCSYVTLGNATTRRVVKLFLPKFL